MSLRVRTLIICVDRDNDIGEKAGLKTPILGREASIAAATKLGLADPEDSDINAIFEAIRVYDRLKSENVGSVEIALIAGDKNLGIVSDRKIGEELDKVLSSLGAESAILVSDGAEDECIIPVIQSRVKIDSVRRVVVRQSKPLESTFYMMKKLIEEPGFSHTFLPPVGLILVLLAISLLFELSGKAIGIILGVIGTYILLKGLGRERLLWDLLELLKQSLYSGRISFVAYICSIVLLILGTFQGMVGSWDYYMKMGSEIGGPLLPVVVFIEYAIWWYVGAALAPLTGKMLNMFIEGERVIAHWAIMFSIIASGIILWGGSKSVLLLNEGNYPMAYQSLFFAFLGAIIISLMGVKISYYAKTADEGEEGKAEVGLKVQESK